LQILLKVEIARWLRTSRFLVALFAGVFVALTAPLAAYFLPELLTSAAGTYNVTIQLPEVGSADLISSYFRTSSQILLLAYCYLVSLTCSIGSDKSLQLFYITRTHSKLRIVSPRLLVATAAISISIFLSAIVVCYEISALVSATPSGMEIKALIIQSIGILLFTIIAGLGTTISRSVFIPPLVLFALSIVGGVFSVVDGWRWLATVLLQPDIALLQADGLGTYRSAMLITLCIVGVELLFIWLTRKKRRNSDR